MTENNNFTEEERKFMYNYLVTVATQPIALRHLSAETQMKLFEAVADYTEEVLDKLGYSKEQDEAAQLYDYYYPRESYSKKR